MPALDLIAWILTFLWALLLFGGYLLGKDPNHYRRMPRWTRLTSSLILVLLGWYGYSLAVPDPASDFAFLIALGMSAGWVGDLIMARLVLVGNRLLGGMTAFGLGHIAYILAALRNGSLSLGALIGWLLLGALLTYLVVLRGNGKNPLGWAALLYALLLSATAGVATSLALADSLFAGMAVGAALFLLSDLILAAEVFTARKLPWHGDWVWLTYGPGQALIVLSIWAAMQSSIMG